MNSEEARRVVKEKYSELVVNRKSCCCGSVKTEQYSRFNSDYTNLDGYVSEADLQLGCGIPVEFANIREGDSVLDLGSGAGNDCFVARSVVGESGHITGLDFTREMIRTADENNRKMEYDNVEFILGDIEKMPFEDHSFDVVVSNCVLNLVPDKLQAFKEIKRVLKHGGHFCISDIVLKGFLPDPVRESASLYAGCVSGAIEKANYIEMIHQAGFTHAEVKNETRNYIPDEIMLEHISKNELQKYKSSGAGIYSLTIYGNQ